MSARGLKKRFPHCCSHTPFLLYCHLLSKQLQWKGFAAVSDSGLPAPPTEEQRQLALHVGPEQCRKETTLAPSPTASKGNHNHLLQPGSCAQRRQKSIQIIFEPRHKAELKPVLEVTNSPHFIFKQ